MNPSGGVQKQSIVLVWVKSVEVNELMFFNVSASHCEGVFSNTFSSHDNLRKNLEIRLHG